MSDQEFNIKFVKEVEKHEELYNNKIPEYTRRAVTERAWQEVAAKVDMSANECREKWRNLRTVFMRKLKPLPCGAKKKPYYLENAMKFCLPFIKIPSSSSSGNLQIVTRNSCLKDDVAENLEVCKENAFHLRFAHLVQSPQTSPTSSPSPEQTTDRLVQSASSCQVKKKLSGRNKSAADTNHCSAEYVEAKKPRMEENVKEGSHKADRQESLKMFLLSLIPELEELSDSQIKLFKRRVFSVIDELSAD